MASPVMMPKYWLITFPSRLLVVVIIMEVLLICYAVKIALSVNNVKNIVLVKKLILMGKKKAFSIEKALYSHGCD